MTTMRNEFAGCKKILKILFLASVAALASLPGQLNAAPVEDESYFFEPKNHIEISGTFESLNPHSTYGNWKAGSIMFQQHPAVDFTWFARASTYVRKSDGNGRDIELGAYKDWDDAFYTFTSVSTGSNTAYIPKFRVNQDFNFKLGKEKNYVFTLGGSFIKYHNDHRDYILGTGITTYGNRWFAGFEIFRNWSQPGSVVSYSRQLTFGVGKERQQMTTLMYSWGKQAYLATELAPTERVNSDSKLLTLNHRKWLGLFHDHGYFTELSYFDLEDGYRSYGCELGIFWEF